ncbi:MAG: zinc ribbon domain-containing protein [Ruminococcus sp.]|nr:zinc ribbon domain-containing protein [Ruminococcus sp.]
MALIKCPECGKEISSEAKRCPHCGKRLKTPWYKSWIFWTVTGVIIFIAIMISIVIIQMNEGAELARQSEFYQEMDEISEDAKRASSRSESAIEELDEMQDQLDYLLKD